jgi:outer membrane protein TolC
MLKTLRKSVEVQKLENQTGIFLPNPEVEFSYFWGKPSIIGNRTDISVTQTFDIPTISGIKKKYANTLNARLEEQYKMERMQILLNTKRTCIAIVYHNALEREWKLRLEHAQTIVDAYKERFNNGDVSILEYNKAQFNLANVKAELTKVEVEKNTQNQILNHLNGGKSISISDADYHDFEIPSNFDVWFEQIAVKHPQLSYFEKEKNIAQNSLKLSKASAFPEFFAGYISENIVNQHFQGITVGMNIPIWENKNRIKQAKMEISAAEMNWIANRQILYNQLLILYQKAVYMKNLSEQYQKSIRNLSNSYLLKKALDGGEISLLEYITEMSLYYDMENKALETERDYRTAVAELEAAYY